ncbi:uncharacterized protein V1513DRAFT_438754 [Lipomyces chichibuensis]|uniref:uncharacterized protein n=1 Tax=Lipomyces chichibuensis TaxID=1546026 RepID=UPI00334374A2
MAGEYLKRPRQADEDNETTMQIQGHVPRQGYTPSRAIWKYNLDLENFDATENGRCREAGADDIESEELYITEEFGVKRLRLDDLDSDIADESPSTDSTGGGDIGDLYDSGIDEGISYAPGVQHAPAQSPEAIEIDRGSNQDWQDSIFSNDTEYSEATQMLDAIAPFLQRMQDDMSTNTLMLMEDFRRIGISSTAAHRGESTDIWSLWQAGDNVMQRLEAVADDYVAFVDCFVKREMREYAELIKCYLGKYRQHSAV